jgi:hypothetical protein
VWEVTKYEFDTVTYGIRPRPNFIKILRDIISLLNAHNRISQVKLKLGYVCDAHAQSFMGNGIFIIPPHDFSKLVLPGVTKYALTYKVNK